VKVYFVNRFYYPDSSATSQILTELATGLASGFRVNIITSRQLHDNPRAKQAQREERLGVTIRRLRTTRFGRDHLWGRAIDYASFYIHVFLFLLFNIRQRDVVVLMTDPPLLVLLNTSAIKFARAGRNWLQDIFPEIASRLGQLRASSWPFRLLAAWRDRSLNVAAANVVISPRMAAYLAQRGVSNVRIIPNWADEQAIAPVLHENNPLREQWQLANSFAVIYSGNFGRVHAFDEIINAVRELAGEPGIRFVFIGKGAALEPLRQAVQDIPAVQVSFKAPQRRESLAYSLGAADLHLVSLKMGMEDLVLPSKLHGVLAAGRPVAFIGDTDSDIAAMIRRENVGFSISLGDGAGLANRIRQLASDPGMQEVYRANARALFLREHTQAQGVARWRKLLRDVAPSGVGAPDS
jgi:glycosyltransferase involved in cell wall biosynthesis